MLAHDPDAELLEVPEVSVIGERPVASSSQQFIPDREILLQPQGRPAQVLRLIPGFVLILIGAVQMAGPRDCDRRGGPFRGLWPILVGAWLIVNAVQLWGLTYRTSWPLLIVAIGVLMVLRELFPGARQPRGRKH